MPRSIAAGLRRLVFAGLACGGVAAAKPQFAIPPGPILMDDRVAIRVVGLPANAVVTIRASSRDQRGCWWRSAAAFQAHADGAIDLAAQAPVSGSYTGVDAMGLFWSMRTECGGRAFFEAADPFQPVVTELEALSGGRQVATARVTRRFAADGLRREAVKADGVVGVLYRPAGDGAHPGVILLGGSEGGVPGPEGPMLASRGFTTLALAYFGAEGLPATMQNIPLEYFRKAVQWMGNSVILIGGSRGSEAALMTAAMDARVNGVIVTSPSNVRWEGTTAKMMPGGPAWTLEGRPLPYVPFHIGVGFAAQFVWRRISGGGLSLLPMFLDSLGRGTRDDAEIAVENIRGPVLFGSGADDRKWPSGVMAGRAIERLRRLRHAYEDTHVSFAGAGHWLPVAYLPTTGLKGAMAEEIGGTAEAEARAQAQWWPRVLAFLRERTAAR